MIIVATQSEVAAHLDLSQPAVSQLVAEGVLPAPAGRAGLDVNACRVAYLRRLREQAAGRMPIGDGPADLDLVAERARLASAQADAQEMRNDVMRGQVVLSADVAAVIGECCATVRNRLLALPSEKAPAVHRCRTVAEVQGVLSDAVREALTELSSPEALTPKPSRAQRKDVLRRLQSGG